EGYGGKPWVSLCSEGRRGPRRSRAPPLFQFAVAMLVFLAGTARTRFVATDLLAGPCERLRLFEHRYVSFFLGLEIRFGYAGTAVAEDRMFVVHVRGRFRLLHLLELFGT